MGYEHREINAPHLTGLLLRTMVGLVEAPVTSGVLRSQLLASAGVDLLLHAPVDENPTPLPLYPVPDAERASAKPGEIDLAALAKKGSDAPGVFETAADFRQAYLDGKATPTQVAERMLAAVARSEQHGPALRIFISQQRDDVLQQAEAATERYRAGKTLGPLDGVPVAVKDELDVQGYGTTVGTAFLGKTPAARDAFVVARLRAAGAVITGKTNMHEIGIGVTGVNMHHGTCRNPYNPQHKTGGSSSGPAAAVAAGLCPIAVGADGGGSIRMPAALCGVVGLKATYARLGETGVAPLCWSLGHVGPLAATARDAALAYAVMAGPDPDDHHSHIQPPVSVAGFDQLDVKGLKLGVYRPWFEDAEPAVVAVGKQLLDSFTQRGAQVVDIVLDDLRLFHLAQLVTIVSEMYDSHRHHVAAHRSAYGYDVRLNFALGAGFTGSDYVHAQRMRTRAIKAFGDALQRCDVILSPATGVAAPPIPPTAVASGESNLRELDAIMRFATFGNLTGLPAIAFPAGYTDAGLPVGYQFMGRPWSEAQLLRLAHVVESFTARKAPMWHAKLLEG